MGRRPLQRIMDEKSRKLTFLRRWIGLQKKAHELSILCALDTCLIVFADDGDSSSHAPPLFWPPNPDQVTAILRRYKQQHAKARALKKINDQGVSPTEDTEYPTRVLDHRFFDGLSVQQCKDLVKFCEAKLEKVRSRIDRLRKMGREGGPAMQNPNFTDIPMTASTQLLEVPHLSAVAALDCPSMEPDFFGGPSDCSTLFSPPYSDSDAVAASSSAMLPPPQHQFFYEQPCSGMSDNINIVYSRSTSSSWPPAIPPYNYYYGYPAQYAMLAAPIQSLPPQMNTDGNESWEQYLRFD